MVMMALGPDTKRLGEVSIFRRNLVRKRKRAVIVPVWCLVILMFGFLPLSAQAEITEPFITPENPTEQDDLYINFTTSGCHSLFGVTPYLEFDSPNALSFVAAFDDNSPFCILPEPLREFSFPIGRLVSGTYQLTLVNAIYGDVDPEPIGFEDLYTIEFTVGAARSIPVMGLVGSTVTVVLILVMGAMALASRSEP